METAKSYLKQEKERKRSIENDQNHSSNNATSNHKKIKKNILKLRSLKCLNSKLEKYFLDFHRETLVICRLDLDTL